MTTSVSISVVLAESLLLGPHLQRFLCITGVNSNGFLFAVQQLVQGTIYSYNVPSGGYDANGNLVSYADSVMGTWTFGYDYLNRLITGTASPASFDGGFFCWSYDSFGNRIGQTGASVAFSTGSPQCQVSGATISDWGHYNANNQLTGTNQEVPSYDAAGNIMYDGNSNYYLYDGEGRICAVKNTAMGTMTQYIYDADGNRVSKGTITTFSCDSATFSPSVSTTSNYILDLSGQQLTEVDGTGAWQHTNLFAAGMLVATYDNQGLHYHLSDPLGTRRLQTDSNGIPLSPPSICATCLQVQSLSFS